MTNIETRRGKIAFQKQISDGDKEVILGYLESLERIGNIHFENNRVEFDYPFPHLTLGIVVSRLDDGLPDCRTKKSIYFSLLSFMERNERDYIVYRPGWDRYVEDIYIHYFNQRHGGKRDVRNMLWRKYKKFTD